MEHRWGERSRLNIPVQVDCGPRGTALGVMRDASASGAFLCTAAQIPLWTSVRVAFTGAHTLSVDAQVVRRAQDGFGLEWSELAPRVIVDLLNAPRATPVMGPPRIETPTQIAPSIAPSVPPHAAAADDTAAGQVSQ